MLGLGSSFMTLRLSNLLLALTLVVSWLAATVQADSSLGTDAPGPSADSGGDSTAYNAAGASGSNGGLSKTAQIAIGVVVGVIGIAASMLPRKASYTLSITLDIDIYLHLLHSCRRYYFLLPKKEEVG